MKQQSRRTLYPTIAPSSHRYARRPRSGEGADAAFPIEAPMGSLVVWNGNLWHGAFPRTEPGEVLTM
jgi:ectoine hydroxylase-related dioxygenase (phytanoyl-CoA dioxygenase family)